MVTTRTEGRHGDAGSKTKPDSVNPRRPIGSDVAGQGSPSEEGCYLAKRLEEVVFGLDPKAEAIEFDGRWYRWGDLRATAISVEHALGQLGVGQGKRIGVFLPNRPAAIGALCAAIVANRPVYVISPFQPTDESARECARAGLAAVIVGENSSPDGPFPESVTSWSCPVIELDERGQAEIRDGPRRRGRSEKEPGITMLTSGTTGTPKRVLLSYASLGRALLRSREHTAGRHDAGEVRLRRTAAVVSFPVAHIAGLFATLLCLSEGRRFAMLDRFAVEAWADLIERHQPLATGLPPAAIRMILEADLPSTRLRSLRAIRVGSAPISADLIEAFEKRYEIPLLIDYGATEFAGGLAGWTMRDYRTWGRTKQGSVGRAQPGVELRIVGQESGRDVPPGQQGLLLVRRLLSAGGANGRWVRTNDLARLDQDGFLWIDGRIDDVINRGGFKVYLPEVEAALLEHPDISEAAVVGIEDDRLGQVPGAEVVLRNGARLSEPEIQTWLRGRLASYKVPACIVVTGELPRTGAMKVSRAAVQSTLAEQYPRRVGETATGNALVDPSGQEGESVKNDSELRLQL